MICGEYEIRTHGAMTPTRFPSVRLKPLGQLSIYFKELNCLPRLINFLWIEMDSNHRPTPSQGAALTCSPFIFSLINHCPWLNDHLIRILLMTLAELSILISILFITFDKLLWYRVHSNHRHFGLQPNALPTELQHHFIFSTKCSCLAMAIRT